MLWKASIHQKQILEDEPSDFFTRSQMSTQHLCFPLAEMNSLPRWSSLSFTWLFSSSLTGLHRFWCCFKAYTNNVTIVVSCPTEQFSLANSSVLTLKERLQKICLFLVYLVYVCFLFGIGSCMYEVDFTLFPIQKYICLV